MATNDDIWMKTKIRGSHTAPQRLHATSNKRVHRIYNEVMWKCATPPLFLVGGPMNVRCCELTFQCAV